MNAVRVCSVYKVTTNMSDQLGYGWEYSDLVHKQLLFIPVNLGQGIFQKMVGTVIYVDVGYEV